MFFEIHMLTMTNFLSSIEYVVNVDYPRNERGKYITSLKKRRRFMAKKFYTLKDIVEMLNGDLEKSELSLSIH